MGPSVLVIGAGGNFGSAVMNEFIRQSLASVESGSRQIQQEKNKFT